MSSATAYPTCAPRPLLVVPGDAYDRSSRTDAATLAIVRGVQEHHSVTELEGP